MHGFACSGMLPVHYARFVKGANIGFIHQKNRDKCLQIMHSKIEEEYRESIEMALWGEVGCQNENEDGIDARHGWQKKPLKILLLLPSVKRHTSSSVKMSQNRMI